MIVRVAPLRRLPTERDWLEYDWSLPTPPLVGQLVRIPLRASTFFGLVWEILKTSTVTNLKPVTSVVLEQPILTDWQRQVLTVMAQTGAASLGEILLSAVPRQSLRTWQKLKAATGPGLHSSSTSSATQCWYRQRSTGLTNLREWTRQHTGQRCVIAPTIDDVLDIVRVLEPDGHPLLTISSDLSAGKLTAAWQIVRHGRPVVVVGTLRALTLPWSQPPAIYLDQQEHHAHKHTASHPRLDTRVILDQAAVPYSWSSPAPTVTAIQHQPNLQPDQLPSNRRVVNLNREQGWQWLSDETQLAIDQAITQNQRVLCIAPRAGYARTMVCRQCQHVVRCPSCQRPASIVRGLHHQGQCTVCRHEVQLNLSCPNCHGTTWSWRGLGVEHVTEAIRQRWPNVTVAPLFHPEAASQISVDTYAAYHGLLGMKDIGLVVVVHGDAVLHYPDYSAAERAWQYLSRLAASTTAPVIVQTWQPTQTFWQRWQHGDDRPWYTQELADRQRYGLPPSAQQWVLRFRGSLTLAKRQIAEFQHDHPQTKVSELPSRNAIPRWVVTFTDSQRPDWRRYFPTPWQVDLYPTSWLD